MYKQVKKFNTLTIGFLYNCLKYVRTGFKIDKTVPTAWQSWQQNTTKHKDLNHPKNVDVPIYFSGAGGYGHVVTWVARKKRYYSSPYRRFSFRATFKTLLEIERIYKCKVVGWAESVNGVRVIAKVPEPKKPIKKSNEQIAKEVINGKWGNGPGRKQRLEKAGYNYKAIQAIVNKKVR